MTNALRTDLSYALDDTQERRLQPRVGIDCSALIRLNPAITFPAKLTDLSHSAAQVVCDARYALMIDPSGSGKSLEESKPLELAVALPFDDFAEDFKTRCRVKYCSTIPGSQQREKMVLGLKFLSTDFVMLQKLDRILELYTNP
jgi:hypothetical protein